jgi:transcriptional regulator with XRE-family HTH domain
MASEVFMVEPDYGGSNIGGPISISYEGGNTDWMESHGQRVRRLRKALGWTQQDLETEAKVDQSTLSGIESKNAVPSADTLIRIARALQTTAEYVMEGKSPSWPFSIEMERFLALTPESRAFVEGKLEAAIESREGDKPIRTAQVRTDEAVTVTTPRTPRKSRREFPGEVRLGGRDASGEPGSVPKSRGRRGT